eukprot:7341477-Pyramimonas_sp.AAC.1
MGAATATRWKQVHRPSRPLQSRGHHAAGSKGAGHSGAPPRQMPITPAQFVLTTFARAETHLTRFAAVDHHGAPQQDPREPGPALQRADPIPQDGGDNLRSLQFRRARSTTRNVPTRKRQRKTRLLRFISS